MTLATGAILDNRYRIARLVGQGGFGAVYRAWHLSLNLPIALKENRDSGPESQRQFEREARLLAALRHPNLPRVMDHFVIPGQGQYLVMDFIEGRSLRALLEARGGPLDEAEALPWMRQVCDALTYLHTRTPPIIHRDIKPDNIIITNDGRAMLVDFGISKVYDPDKGTTVGAKAVTPGYSPPEQYGRGRTGAWSDVYSLGATLYTLLTGQVPPEAPDLSSGADELTPPAEANPVISAATARAIEAAMTLPISQRLPDAAEFTQALPLAVEPTERVTPPGYEAAVHTTPSGEQVVLGDSTPPLPSGEPTVQVVSPVGEQTMLLEPEPALAGPHLPPIQKNARRKVPFWGLLFGVTALVALAVWAAMTFNARDGGTLPTLRVVNRGGVQVEQVFVPAGSFMMGSEDGQSDERPVHEVTLDAFWIDRTEVTNAQYAACVADRACRSPEHNSSYTRDGYYDDPHYADFPVIWVSWEDAAAFVKWAEGRLPTEAEWEYAARGPENAAYPWGHEFDDKQLNFCDANCPLSWANRAADDGYADTALAGSFPGGASWVGALDMAGNVWEWVNDWYNDDYYRTSPAANPTGPLSGVRRVWRGGSWYNVQSSSRTSVRYHGTPDLAVSFAGFRVVTPVDSGS